eukprot:8309672-Pyramimonas_sp.AAC.1
MKRMDHWNTQVGTDQSQALNRNVPYTPTNRSPSIGIYHQARGGSHEADGPLEHAGGKSLP